jgi:hypothetical protein
VCVCKQNSTKTAYSNIGWILDVDIGECHSLTHSHVTHTLTYHHSLSTHSLTHVSLSNTLIPYSDYIIIYHSSLIALLHYYTTTLLHYYTTALLHYCTTSLLHYCTTTLQTSAWCVRKSSGGSRGNTTAAAVAI